MANDRTRRRLRVFGRNAQIPVIRRRRGQWAKSTLERSLLMQKSSSLRENSLLPFGLLI
jgi:hypothetical protein